MLKISLHIVEGRTNHFLEGGEIRFLDQPKDSKVLEWGKRKSNVRGGKNVNKIGS
jgi:hypothetical protein